MCESVLDAVDILHLLDLWSHSSCAGTFLHLLKFMEMRIAADRVQNLRSASVVAHETRVTDDNIVSILLEVGYESRPAAVVVLVPIVTDVPIVTVAPIVTVVPIVTAILLWSESSNGRGGSVPGGQSDGPA